jgi:hypothetical protein
MANTLTKTPLKLRHEQKAAKEEHRGNADIGQHDSLQQRGSEPGSKVVEMRLIKAPALIVTTNCITPRTVIWGMWRRVASRAQPTANPLDNTIHTSFGKRALSLILNKTLQNAEAAEEAENGSKKDRRLCLLRPDVAQALLVADEMSAQPSLLVHNIGASLPNLSNSSELFNVARIFRGRDWKLETHDAG